MSSPAAPAGAGSHTRGQAPGHWATRGPLALALLPAALLFGALAALRRAAYRTGLVGSRPPPCPLIVVGNIAVGGSGKTPVVLWLANRLRTAGLPVGIVSRGYHGSVAGVSEVPVDADPARYGDEAAMLAATSGCPVFVGRDRPAAARALLAAHPRCRVIVSDDGLQHYAMQRTVEIAVVDQQVLGNRLLLPAGPLREPVERLRAVDLVLLHGAVSAELRARIGPAPAFPMGLRPAGVLRLADGERSELADWAGRRVHAVAGIGRPRRFFEMLAEHGLEVVPHPFPDHHAFGAADLVFSPPAPILMTSKDAVKCRSFAPHDCWEVVVDADIDERAFATIMEKLGHGQSPA